MLQNPPFNSLPEYFPWRNDKVTSLWSWWFPSFTPTSFFRNIYSEYIQIKMSSVSSPYTILNIIIIPVLFLKRWPTACIHTHLHNLSYHPGKDCLKLKSKTPLKWHLAIFSPFFICRSFVITGKKKGDIGRILLFSLLHASILWSLPTSGLSWPWAPSHMD